MEPPTIMRTSSAPHGADHPLNIAFYEGIETADQRYEEAKEAVWEAENKVDKASAEKTRAALIVSSMIRHATCTIAQLEASTADLELKMALLCTAMEELELANEELCLAIEAFTG